MVCDKCGSTKVRVVFTKVDVNGYKIRRRKCADCGHKYYTVQGAERVITNREIAWLNGLGSHNWNLRFTGTL